jgi:triosephosphate isomerase (TIM)
MQKYIVGNWKMNGTSADLAEINAIVALAQRYRGVKTALCLPATLIHRASAKPGGFSIGGQDCHMQPSGAHTGCVSAEMLVDAGAVVTIVGHSERRADQHESSSDIRAKAKAAKATGLAVIVCVGETLDERDAGRAFEVVLGQLAESLPDSAAGGWLSVAYEPVWAIGTGRIPAKEDVAAMHKAIRETLVERFGRDTGQGIAILYGGSMNGDNADMLLSVPDVDGGLIGGASLAAAKFEPILAAAAKYTE